MCAGASVVSAVRLAQYEQVQAEAAAFSTVQCVSAFLAAAS